MPKTKTATILAQYCDWDYARNKFLPEAGDAGIHLPARITKCSYVVRYGGAVKDMESGKGNVRKILPRFRRRFAQGEPITSWRHLIGSHDRLTRAKIMFTLVES